MKSKEEETTMTRQEILAMANEDRKNSATGSIREAKVMGVEFLFWADFNYRCTKAINCETGEIERISSNGYITADRTVRKAIAAKWHMPRFSEK